MSPPEIRLLLSEATNTVREVQAIAQRVIADLSPPGLYELGLEPALKWLSVYMRSKDNLQVDLKVTADDAGIDHRFASAGVQSHPRIAAQCRQALRRAVRPRSP